MEAIILAGGIGSMLKGFLKDIPKPMAPINGKPFLEIILDHLNISGFKSVVLSVGHLSYVIEDHFGNSYKNITIKYAVEKERLGTGGAIKYALNFCKQDYIFIFNGDTFLDLDFKELLSVKEKNQLNPIMVSRNVEDVSRYGSLVTNNNKLIDYREKKDFGRGDINAGCYILPRTINLNKNKIDTFSFESTSIPLIMTNKGFIVFKHKGLFIDIGVPEDLLKASALLNDLTNI